jgi:hypothetical protein
MSQETKIVCKRKTESSSTIRNIMSKKHCSSSDGDNDNDNDNDVKNGNDINITNTTDKVICIDDTSTEGKKIVFDVPIAVSIAVPIAVPISPVEPIINNTRYVVAITSHEEWLIALKHEYTCCTTLYISNCDGGVEYDQSSQSPPWDRLIRRAFPVVNTLIVEHLNPAFMRRYIVGRLFPMCRILYFNSPVKNLSKYESDTYQWGNEWSWNHVQFRYASDAKACVKKILSGIWCNNSRSDLYYEDAARWKQMTEEDWKQRVESVLSFAKDHDTKWISCLPIDSYLAKHPERPVSDYVHMRIGGILSKTQVDFYDADTKNRRLEQDNNVTSTNNTTSTTTTSTTTTLPRIESKSSESSSSSSSSSVCILDKPQDQVIMGFSGNNEWKSAKTNIFPLCTTLYLGYQCNISDRSGGPNPIFPNVTTLFLDEIEDNNMTYQIRPCRFPNVRIVYLHTFPAGNQFGISWFAQFSKDVQFYYAEDSIYYAHGIRKWIDDLLEYSPPGRSSDHIRHNQFKPCSLALLQSLRNIRFTNTFRTIYTPSSI